MTIFGLNILRHEGPVDTHKSTAFSIIATAGAPAGRHVNRPPRISVTTHPAGKTAVSEQKAEKLQSICT